MRKKNLLRSVSIKTESFKENVWSARLARKKRSLARDEPTLAIVKDRTYVGMNLEAITKLSDWPCNILSTYVHFL